MSTQRLACKHSEQLWLEYQTWKQQKAYEQMDRQIRVHSYDGNTIQQEINTHGNMNLKIVKQIEEPYKKRIYTA